jgi:hypothetical protein
MNATTTMQNRLLAILAAAALVLGISMLGGCGNNNAASSSAAQASASSSTAATSETSEQLSVTVSVDLTAADGKVETAEVSVPAGATVLEATEATSFELDVQDSQYGKFVNAINGVATGDHGDQSGWLVAVNGEDLAVSADAQEVKDGDKIEWRYVTTFE